MTDLCFCGHDCARCLVRLADEHGDEALAARAIAFYRDAFGVEVPREKLHCKGGRSDAVFYLCEGCPFRRCCIERGLHSCKDCAEPCTDFLEYQKKYVNRCGQL